MKAAIPALFWGYIHLIVYTEDIRHKAGYRPKNPKP